MGYAAAVLSTAAGVLASLGLFVLVMASTANATEAQVAAAKRWMLLIAFGGLVTAAGAVYLALHGRPWSASLVGGSPAAGMLGLFIWVEVSRE